uniref:restriction endonuclease subunit S n=1 Tax=Limosilactobacillus mucosae TaxID=97478 RepID=UPI0022E564D0
WEQRKLGEIATIVGGGTPSTKNPEYWDGDINWYSPAEIGNQIYIEKSERQITELGLKKSSAKLLPVGTVLFTSRAGIGKTAILNKEACTNQGFQSIIPRSKMLNSYFLFSRTNSLKQYGETMGSGSTFVEVSGKQMSKMPLFIPNINEQSKIAKLFQSLDRTITLHEEQHRQLERLKKALLQKMFADETGYPMLRFKGFTEKWEQVKLSKTSRSYSGGTPKVGVHEYYDGQIPFIRSGEIASKSTELTISETGLNNSSAKLVSKGDILYALYGATSGEVSLSKINGAINQAILAIKPIDGYENYFLMTWLQKEKEQITRTYLQGGQGNLSAKIVMNLVVNIPSLSEQSQIAQIFSKLDKTITLHDKKIQYLKQLKRGLLQKMFV